MEKKHLRMIVLQDAEILCKDLCLMQTLTLLALFFEFCKWLCLSIDWQIIIILYERITLTLLKTTLDKMYAP